MANEDSDPSKEVIANMAKEFKKDNYNLKKLFVKQHQHVRDLIMMNVRFKIAAFLALIVPVACDSGTTNLSGSSVASVDNNSGDAKAIALTDLTSIKVKNCDQLFRTMSKVTGVDFNDDGLKGFI